MGLYGLLTALGLYYHEPWRDETHSWLIARLSQSLPQLFHNIRYEGHPVLWYLILYLVKPVSGKFEMAQVVHWLISGAAGWLLLTRAPFPYRVRILLLFSYFLFYEYAIIARNYAIGILLLFLIADQFRYRRRRRGYLAVSSYLFLLFQTNVYPLLIGLVLYGFNAD